MTQEKAREALYAAIAETADAAKNYGGTTSSAMVRDAAIAFRAVAGGPQPGSVIVDSK